jgi:hypothetical protein
MVVVVVVVLLFVLGAGVLRASNAVKREGVRFNGAEKLASA